MTHKVAVGLVKKDLMSLGYEVVAQKYSAAKGADIEVWTGKRGFKVEVKIPYKLKNGGWQINQLSEKNADMVAIVLKSKRIVYTSIQDHSKIASVKGFRGVSNYINFFGK